MKTSTRCPCPLTSVGQPMILLAEDDPDQSEMLAEALRDEGYLVDAAFSGDTANQKLQHHQYDLIILDIRMPGMDGEAVLKQLRTREITAKVPVFVVSAFATETDMRRYAASGATGSFAKPYELDELLAHIAKFVPGKKAV